MRRIFLPAMVMMLAAASCMAAEPFNASLRLSDPDHSQSTTQPTTQTTEASRDAIQAKRPLLESSVNAPLVARWKLTYVGTEPVKDVVVHFYVARIDQLGQAPPALEPAIVLAESALLMDFDPKSGCSAEVPFRAITVGKYLVWIEATIKGDKETHEQHEAIELIVK